MPIYLRHDSIRLLEASLESLHLAITSLGTEKRIEFREPSSKWAIEIGLIGAAAELAMAACLVQAYGTSSLILPNGKFKSFVTILEEFRTLVTSAPPRSNFLTKDVADSNAHRARIHELTFSFRLLATVRAAGLHAGSGLLWEATVVQANTLSDFIQALAESTRMRPYLSPVPRCLLFDRERTIILEDLSRRLNETGGAERNQALASIFLVLPEIPENEPDWIDALERISIAPQDQDITFLLDILGRAMPATMRRTTAVGRGLAVAVRPNDPNALPIAPQFLRRQFNQIQEQWYADIGTANGRLEQGVLDLPPIEAVREVFALGFETTNIQEQGTQFQAHEVWPFIAASLNARGTIGPYWFLVRRTNDLNQLLALMTRASNAGSRILAQNIVEFRIGIEAIQNGTPIDQNVPEFAAMIENIILSETLRERIVTKGEASIGTDKELPQDIADATREIQENGTSMGTVLISILDNADLRDCWVYWAKTLSDVACDRDDLPALVRILADAELTASHTAARKALKRIDFLLHGPPSEIPDGTPA